MKRSILILFASLFAVSETGAQNLYENGKLRPMTREEISKRNLEIVKERATSSTPGEEKPVTVKVLREILTKCDTVECVKIEVDKLD